MEYKNISSMFSMIMEPNEKLPVFYSLSNKSRRKISQSLETARLGVKIIRPLWLFTGYCRNTRQMSQRHNDSHDFRIKILTLCLRNPVVSTPKGTEMRNVFFDVSLNKPLNKQTRAYDLKRHDSHITSLYYSDCNVPASKLITVTS